MSDAMAPLPQAPVVHAEIQKHAEELNSISQELWKNPELGLEEYKAHDLVTKFLEKNGFDVKKSYILPTAFRAEYVVPGVKSGPDDPVVCVICEYDALPEIGHACGHNLICEAGLAAGLATKAAMIDGKLPGKLVVMGTPNEEGNGGKINLIKGGAFEDVHCAMMVHPFATNQVDIKILGLVEVVARFFGKAAHAAASPWEGNKN